MHSISSHQLNNQSEDISIMSYNILLPNSELGWWVFKYYHPEIPLEQTTWSYRKELLKQQICKVDLLTLQECNPETIDQDLDFLESTYTKLCHRRARIAMATCWNTERFELVADYHLNRCLVTVLKERTGVLVCVVNCHLSAGRHPKERFQQIVKSMDQVRKLRDRFELDLIVFSGDFNSSADGTAVQRFLEDGLVEPRFRESYYSNIPITSKVKEHNLGRFSECYRHITDRTSMWVRNSSASMLHHRSQKARKPFLDALNRLFDFYADGEECLSKVRLEKWITEMNLELRGSEYTEAMNRLTDNGLMRSDFINIYINEVQAGKHWAVYHDLLRRQISIPTPNPLVIKFALDQIWYRSNKFECSGVVPPLSNEVKSRIESGEFVPNSWHPSDHFPLMVRFSPRVW